MKTQDQIKLFGLNNLAIESAIRRTEKAVNYDFRPTTASQEDEEFYPQFPAEIRRQAASMAHQYEIFYCLETSIRQLVVERLKEEGGLDWWEKMVPDEVQRNAEQNRNRESATGMTLRSDNMVDYTTFGELAQIINKNAAIFGDTFRDLRAVSRILTSLNNLRSPIAHCCPLAEDEIDRLNLSLKDWFRQMS